MALAKKAAKAPKRAATTSRATASRSTSRVASRTTSRTTSHTATHAPSHAAPRPAAHPVHRAHATPPADAATGATVDAGASGEAAGVRVRMYRVGFGDCFLLSFPAEGGSGKEHVLIDCGVFKGTSGEGDIGTIAGAVDDMVKETGGQLALVIMTHRHADHIIGFSRCKEQFQKMKVGAVWMPIWEQEYEDGGGKARVSKFQADLSGIATRMQIGLAASAAAGRAAASDPVHAQTMQFLMNATGPLAAAGGGTNAASLDLLKRGFGVKPAYYAAGDTPEVPEPLARAGVSARILGPPPVDDLAFMKLMDLTKGVGQYLDGDSEQDDEDAFAPFGKDCEVGVDAYTPLAFAEWRPRSSGARASRTTPATDGSATESAERMQKAVASAQPASLLEAAKTLDAFLNNQSLVVLFTFRGKNLLFVGDAQAGNWEHWLYANGKPDKSASAPISADGKSILDTIDFYKVGHHGSTNATPRAAVEAMRPGIVAMCSTQPGVYGTASKGTEVPRGPLIDALEAKLTLVRSDSIEATANGKAVDPSKDAAAPGHPAHGTLVPGEGWIDYEL